MQNSDKFKTSLGRALAGTETLLYKYGFWVVLIVAFFYYGQYYRSGLNLSGEGGTTAMIAMRLLDGQKPISDTFLGYNVMWFYPVVWLFQLTGPSYVALRIYFFVLCTLTAVLAFFVIRKSCGRGWFAVLIAMGPLLVPGMIFRNYMGFLTVLNMVCLLQAYVFEHKSRFRQALWMAVAGGAIGLTYLVRIDLGIFFTIICLGLIVLYPLGVSGQFRHRLVGAFTGFVLLIVMFLATHTPVYLDARQRGFAESFTGQYLGWLGLIRAHAEEKISQAPPAATPAAIAKTGHEEKTSPAVAKEAPPSSTEDRPFTLALHLPIFISLFIVAAALFALVLALWRRNLVLRTHALVLLTTTGSALTLFAQYFFFRPDVPHLSEFMVPFLIAMACAVWVTAHWMVRYRSITLRISGALFILLCLVDAALYYSSSVLRESSGTIVARKKRGYEFVAKNDVRVLLKNRECKEFQALYDTVMKFSSPGDYVICYPYAPTVNFMTNRRSYEYNLYVDDLHHDKGFHANTIREMQSHRPAVILIEDRAINATEASRFSNWAAPTYAYIRENYRHAGTHRDQEIYIRPDLYDQAQQTHSTP